MSNLTADLLCPYKQQDVPAQWVNKSAIPPWETDIGTNRNDVPIDWSRDTVPHWKRHTFGPKDFIEMQCPCCGGAGVFQLKDAPASMGGKI